MDKQLLKAYIRTIVEEEVSRILPQMLSEAVAQVKQLKENTNTTVSHKPMIDRKRFVELMEGSQDKSTVMANTDMMRLPEGTPRDADPEIVKAITKDYSAMMKAMKIT